MRSIFPTTVFKRNRAFSLIELLAVITLIVILTTLSIVSFNGILASTRLEQAGRLVIDEIQFARQSAMTLNTDVELRFISSPRMDTDGASSVFWRLQSGILDKESDHTFRPIRVEAKLPMGTLLTTTDALSPILTKIPSQDGDTPATRFVAITIRPNGELDPVDGLSLSARQEWCVTVVPERKATAPLSQIDDFITVQIDPVTSRTRIYRP